MNEIERDLDDASEQMRELGQVLADPQTYAGGRNGDFAELVHRYEEASQKVCELEARWDQIADRLGRT